MREDIVCYLFETDEALTIHKYLLGMFMCVSAFFAFKNLMHVIS